MTKLSFAALAAILLASSAPAFAGDNDLATLQEGSGHSVAATSAPRAQTPRFEAFDAYASAAPVARTQRNTISAPSFQRSAAPFQGSNEATQYVTSY